MKSAAGVLMLLLVLGFSSSYLLPSVYLRLSGITTDAQVTAKQERIEFYRDDVVRHVLEVTYQYIPADTQRPETSSHQVDPATYDSLRIGAPVKVRYAPLPLLRSLHMVALGSELANTTWASRLPHGLDDDRLYFDLSAIGAAVLLGVLAWRRKSHAWAVAAAFGGTVVASAIVPAGFAAFPLLFAVSRKRPGKGYGVALLAAMAVWVPVLYWRVPHNDALPPDSAGPVTATIRQISTVRRIWSGKESAGEDIPQPFQMVDLEFTPRGTREPVHALDRIDDGSVPGLSVGAAVPINYSSQNPRLAQIDGGIRSYRETAVAHMAKLTLLVSAGVMLLILLLSVLSDRVFRRVRRFATDTGPSSTAQQISGLRADELRRKALEKLSKLPVTHPRRSELEELSRLSDDDLRRKILEKIPLFPPDDSRRKIIERFFGKWT